jgi:L-arabinose isomerase
LLDSKVVYRRYASLFFIAGCASTDNELITLEVVHRYVEQMDKYYGNVCELDIIFNFQKAYFILDELLIAGEMQETSKKNVLRCISQQDSLEDMEVSLPVPILYRTRGHSVTTLSLSLQRRLERQCATVFPQPWPCFSRANFPRLRKTWLPRSCRAKQVLAQYIGVLY